MPNGYGAPSSFIYSTDIGPSYAGFDPFVGPTPYMPTLPTIMPGEISVIEQLSDVKFDPFAGMTIPEITGGPAKHFPAESFAEPVGYGPLELVGDVAKGTWDILIGAANTLADAGKFILENLKVGVDVATGAATGVSGIVAQQKQAEAQKAVAEAQKIAAEAYKLKTLAAQMAEPVTIPKATQPLTYITPETGKAPNYMLYIGLAILALFFLGKK